MIRRICSKSLLLIGFAGASLVSNVQAQEHLIDTAKDEVSRVIQLKNKIETEAEKTVAEVSSRSERLARNPLVVLEPASSPVAKPQVAYDQIDSAEPLSGQNFKPASSGSFLPSSQKSFAPKLISKPVIESNDSNTFKPRAFVGNSKPLASNVSFTKTPTGLGSPISAPTRRSESAPLVTTTIAAPEFVNVNEPAKVFIEVRNPGKVTAYDVTLVATLPENVKVDSRNGNFVDGKCTFEIASLRAGENRQLSMDVITTEKRALNIDTELKIATRNQVKVAVREPKLVVSIEGPGQTNIGSKATHLITVANVGDGVAQNVNLIADIPDSFRIIEKSGFERPETLRPGDKAQAKIVSMPHQAGPMKIAFAAEGKSTNAEPASTALRVMQPELRVDARGPDMNFVERDGIYTISVNNPGEVDVNNVEVQFVIPQGVKVTTISRQAKMDSDRRTLTWTFDQIKSSSEQTVQLKAVATDDGEKVCRIRVASDETNEKEVSLKTLIATRAELSIQMQNIGGPVQVGNEATFVVVVENRGSSTANDLEIEVQLPAGMRPASPKYGNVDEDSNAILFADSALGAGKTREFRFSTVGVAKGEHVVRSSLQAGSSKQRIIVENSVFVYEPAQARVSESLQPTVPRR